MAEKDKRSQDILDKMTKGSFADTGRTADNFGEQLDSVLGAPLRVAISEAQKGKFNKDTISKILKQIHADPRSAPTGFDIAEQTGLENPYAKTAIATIADLASVPVPGAQLAKLAGPMGTVAKAAKATKGAGIAEKLLSAPALKPSVGSLINVDKGVPSVVRSVSNVAPNPASYGKTIRTLTQAPAEPKLIRVGNRPESIGSVRVAGVPQADSPALAALKIAQSEQNRAKALEALKRLKARK